MAERIIVHRCASPGALRNHNGHTENVLSQLKVKAALVELVEPREGVGLRNAAELNRVALRIFAAPYGYHDVAIATGDSGGVEVIIDSYKRLPLQPSWDQG